jgi:GLPGLI family protein
MGPTCGKCSFLLSTISIGLLITAFFVLPACKGIISKDSGTIAYEINYPDSMKGDMMTSMLPSKMQLKFIPGFVLNEFKAGMGIITATIIANEEEKTLTSLFKVIDKKYALVYTPEETKAEMSQMPKFRVDFLKETKMVAGYTCKKALLTQIDKPKNAFPVFYTTDIKLKNPNWNLPYSEVPGVLMEYPIQHKDIFMILKAKKVTLEAPEESQFSVSKEYKVVKKDELPEIIQSFF